MPKDFYKKAKFSDGFMVSEESEIAPVVNSGQVAPAMQAMLEAERWKAKYETLKESLEHERKKRKEVETNLNKLAYELGGVKSEVRQLESRIKALTGGEAPERQEEKTFDPKAERSRAPKMKMEAVPASPPAVAEPPKMYIQYASLSNNLVQPLAENPAPVIMETPELRPAKSTGAAVEARLAMASIDNDEEMIMALANSYKGEAEEVWQIGETVLSAIRNDALHTLTQEGVYDFFRGVEKLYSEYGRYRELVNVINYDLKNLDKIIPHIQNAYTVLYHTG